MLVRPIAGLLVVLSMVGCNSRDSSLIAQDRGPNAQDAGVKPLVSLSVHSPSYLATNVDPGTTVRVHVADYDRSRLASLAEAVQHVADSTRVERYPSREIISGKWSVDGNWAAFSPTAQFELGDYLVWFPGDEGGFSPFPKRFNLFRVGSALRISGISLLQEPNSASPELVRVVVKYSEEPKAKDPLSVELLQKQGALWEKQGLSTLSATNYRTATAIAKDKPIRVSIRGVALDGAYSGVPGSRDFLFEFVPVEHQVGAGQVEYYPEPPIPFKLSSEAVIP